jgi:hypothetical protein
VATPSGPSASQIKPIWYGVALVVYVALGIFTKTVVLNWIIGPLFLLLVLYLIPTLVRRVARREARNR